MWVEAQVLEGTDAQVCAASLKGDYSLTDTLTSCDL